jgi:hypothetical protein
MTWFLENWFWMLVVVAFVGMHLVGHGGHGGHAGHGSDPTQRKGPLDKNKGRRDETSSGGHQH